MTPALSWSVVAAVLFGALLHASWNALIKSGHKPQTMVVEAEGHGFFNPANVAELYRRMETFLDKNLPVGAPAAGAGH